MSDQPPTPTPQSDADRIRLKRLAKLQAQAAPSPSSQVTPSAGPSTPPSVPKSVSITIKRPQAPAPSPSPATPQKRRALEFDLAKWEPEVVENVFHTSLDRELSVKNGSVWLKSLENEILSETPGVPRPLRAKADMADRILISRLEMDPNAIIDDSEVASSLPIDQTVFEYLIGCWKRLGAQRSALFKRNPAPKSLTAANEILDNLKELIISYAGLTLQDPSMFPQPPNKPLGSDELLPSLVALGTANSMFSAPSSELLSTSEVLPFLNDLVQRWEADGLQDVLGGVVRSLAFHPDLKQGFFDPTNQWRGIAAALQELVIIKPIARMVTTMDDWTVPDDCLANELEKRSLLGPLFRMGVYAREWPAVLDQYYQRFDDQDPRQLDATQATLNSTLSALRLTLFNIVNSLVRAGPEPKAAVLSYIGTTISLNKKRAGIHVEYETQSTDSFMANWSSVLIRLAEPFMDANYTKLDKIDPQYYLHSSRINVKDETRIKADAQEIEEWLQTAVDNYPIPNFISEVFYLTAAMFQLHFRPVELYLKRIAADSRNYRERIEAVENDPSWRSSPRAAEVERSIKAGKDELSKMHAYMQACFVDLLGSEATQRGLGWVSFVSVWLLHIVDPKRRHPQNRIELPLPQEVPLTFKTLPEYFIEDLVEYWAFVLHYNPPVMMVQGSNELADFSMTFLTSTWYITNPYLKSKLITALAAGVRQSRGRPAVLNGVLSSHPLALKHLMTSLMQFYVEVEKTGTHTQFYDKFTVRHEIAEIMQAVWHDPTHRAVMMNFTSNMSEFIKFAGRLLNDVTFLLDEMLTKLTEIKKIQQEQSRVEEWQALTQERRQDRLSVLRSAEAQASSWSYYSSSMIVLLIEFTSTTRGAFISGEIVGRLAATLNYVLDMLAGARSSDLRTNDMEKYGFNPAQLLSSLLSVYLNLAEEVAFIQAVATEGRSYKKELFERAGDVALKKVLKTVDELEKLRKFVNKVEELRQAMDEEEIDEFPEEFQDPIMYTLMREPVLLPTSKVIVDMSSIKGHLLSDPTDPFNRLPLNVEDVIPQLELTARIDAFVAEKKAKAAKARLNSIQEAEAERAQSMQVDQ